jgi:hypothetical protein
LRETPKATSATRTATLIDAGTDPEDLFDFFASELAEPLRKLTPSS